MNHIIKIKSLLFTLALSMTIFTGNQLLASDHIDFTGAEKNTFVPRELDLSDLFAWTTQTGHLVLGLNTNLLANKDTKFSDTHTYRFRLKGVAPLKRGSIMVTKVDEKAHEITINCNALEGKMSCYSIGAKKEFKIEANLNEVTAAKGTEAVRLFAGLRADPFILDTDWAKKYTIQSVFREIPGFSFISDFTSKVNVPSYLTQNKKEKIELPPVPSKTPHNFSDSLNILNITLEIDPTKILPADMTYLSVAADVVLLADKNNAQSEVKEIVDRVGRPELTNMTIRFDPIKELYNKVDVYEFITAPFSSSIIKKKAVKNVDKEIFRNAIEFGVRGWDRLDKKINWKGEDLIAFVETLVNDYLVVDLTGSCVEKDGSQYISASYLDVELGRNRGDEEGSFKSCGGRAPNDDVVDDMVTYYIAGPGKDVPSKLYGDGADEVKKPASTTWPYFAEPTLTKSKSE